MPEAAMNKDDLSTARKNDVGFARQILSMEAKAITQSMQGAPDDEFRASIL
jgi:hypothetical protein